MSTEVTSKYHGAPLKPQRWSRMKRALSSAFSRRFRLSRNKSGATLDSTHSSSHAIPDEELAVPELPSVLWTTTIFSFLDRPGQDLLAQAHPEVALMRRQSLLVATMDWPRGRLSKFSRPVKKVEFSPDCNRQQPQQQLCVVYCKSKVAVYDKLRGPVHFLKGHTGPIADVKFSPDASVLATAGKSDGTIRLWKQQQQPTPTTTSNNDQAKQIESSYTCFRILQIHQHDLRHMLWSPTGSHIVSWGQDGFVRVSDVETGTLVSSTRHWKTRFEVSGCHEIVAFGGRDGTIAYARNNERVCLWNFRQDTVSVLGDLHDEHGTYAGEYITSVAYSPDGMSLFVGCHVATIKVWRLVPCAQQEQQQQEDSNSTGMDDDTMEYDYVFSKELHLGGGWSAVTLMTFTQDGRYLACSNHGSQIRIVDTTTDQILATLMGGHLSRIESLCFTPDGRTLASGSCDRTVRLWDTSRLTASGCY